MSTPFHPPSTCSTDCEKCPLSEWEQQQHDPAALAGWPLAVAAAAVFLLPLLLALAGAALANGALGQVAGGTTGLAIGIVLARLVQRGLKTADGSRS